MAACPCSRRTASCSPPTAPPGGIWQHEQIQTAEQEQGERQQRRVGDPGRRRPTSPCQGDEVGNDGQRKGNGQPAVGLPNPFVPLHCDLLHDSRPALDGQLGGSMPNCFAYSAWSRWKPPNFIASGPTMRPMG